MTRATEAAFLQFCMKQRDAFVPEEWQQCTVVPRQELVVTMLFLASVVWFGHSKALVDIAAKLRPGAANMTNFPELVKAAQFDCSRFSNNLRRALNHA